MTLATNALGGVAGEYEGERNAAGQEEGEGVMRFRFDSGEEDVYSGHWVAGEREGDGVYTAACGDVYSGQFRAGQQEGKGKYTHASGAVYEGEWAAGMQEGKGTYTYALGDIYTGEWARGEMEGRGVATSANGDLYTGEFKGGKQEGHGAQRHADGRYEVCLGTDGQWEGAIWSADRKLAWLVEPDGSQGDEIALDAARAVADKIDMPGPEKADRAAKASANEREKERARNAGRQAWTAARRQDPGLAKTSGVGPLPKLDHKPWLKSSFKAASSGELNASFAGGGGQGGERKASFVVGTRSSSVSGLNFSFKSRDSLMSSFGGRAPRSERRSSVNTRLSQGYAAALRALRPNKGSVVEKQASARDVWLNAQYGGVSPGLARSNSQKARGPVTRQKSQVDISQEELRAEAQEQFAAKRAGPTRDPSVEPLARARRPRPAPKRMSLVVERM